MSEELELYQDLSRLLEGHLDAHAEAHLRERIATEPTVARAWKELRATAKALDDLPDMPPPPSLDQRVLRGQRRSPGGRTLPRSLLGALALAAAVTLAVLAFPDDQDRLVLLEGEQWVDGQALVFAGGVPIEVDGLARIFVEPPTVAARASRQEVESMEWKHVAAAAAGALVTVAVYEGTAQVGEGGDTVSSGEHWSNVDGPPPEQPRVVRRHLGGEGLESEDDPEVLRARIAELEDQLALKDFEGAIQRGRIAAVEGRAQPWPGDLPPVMRPDAFERRLREEMTSRDELDLLEINCDEYPCYAIIEAEPDSFHQGEPPGSALMRALAEETEEPLGVFNMASVTAGPEGELGLLGVALVPTDRNDDTLTKRLGYRVEGSMSGWSEDFATEEQDVEIDD